MEDRIGIGRIRRDWKNGITRVRLEGGIGRREWKEGLQIGMEGGIADWKNGIDIFELKGKEVGPWS